MPKGQQWTAQEAKLMMTRAAAATVERKPEEGLKDRNVNKLTYKYKANGETPTQLLLLSVQIRQVDKATRNGKWLSGGWGEGARGGSSCRRQQLAAGINSIALECQANAATATSCQLAANNLISPECYCGCCCSSSCCC